MSILARLFLLVALAVLPALAIEGFNQYDLRHERERDVRQNALRLATFAAGELDRIVENGRGLLLALTRLPAVRERDSAACSAYFADLKRLFPQYRVIGATDTRGAAFCASTELISGFSLAEKPFWRQAIESGEFTVGLYNVGKLAKGRILPLSLAFRDASGSIAGLVYVSLDLDWLARYFAEKGFDRNATIAIADRNSTLLLRLPDNESYVGTKLAEVYHSHVYAPEPGTAEIIGVDGVRRILGFVPVDDTAAGLYVGIGLTRAAAFAAIDRATIIGLGMLTVGFALALGAAWIGGRYFISTPIERLAAAAGHWRLGDFRVRVEPRGGGEITLLANAFNEMAAELADQQEENAKLLSTLEQRVDERTRELGREVAERQRAEDALVQSQKMEAIGQLTGGIAHDFNNLLTAIIGNLELAEMRLARGGPDPSLQQNLAHAHRSAERAAALTRDLLAFARRQSLRVEAIDLNAVVRGAEDLLRRTVRPPVRIEHRLADRLWPALADASQIELVILNLSINARDAMPAGGTITIETANLPVGDPRHPADLPEGEYVLLAISDTGTGMAPEVLAKCLEPFFTTKEVGKGSGLGLSVVHGIAKQSRGTLEIRTSPGEGTSVAVFLPRAAAAVVPDGAPRAPEPAAQPATELAARVLLVDDDVEVRQVVGAQLRDLGCSVVEAPNGQAALDLIEAGDSRTFDVLVSDYAMPGLTGTALARAARQLRPELPVLLITGYNDLVADPHSGDEWTWLAKPFRQADLAEHIRRALAAQKSKAEPTA